MKKIKKIGSQLLILTISCMVPFGALAAGPGVVSEKEYDSETRARLLDDIIEYDELGNLVHEYNTSAQDIWSNFEDMEKDMKAAYEELKSQQGKMESLAEDAGKKTEQGMGYQGQAGALKKITKGYSDGIKDMDKWKVTKNFQLAEDQITMIAQFTMMGYSTINSNLQTVQKMKDMYQAKYDLTQQKADLGLATQTEVLAAKAELLEAEANLSSLQDSHDNTRRALIIMLGWSADDHPEIRPLPAPDLSRIDSMNLETDIPAAIGNNQTLIAMRHEGEKLGWSKNNKKEKKAKADKSQSSIDVDRKLRTVSEGEQLLTIEMERLYDDVQQKKLDYDAANIGFESAKISRASVETQYQLGMLGRTEYFGAQLTHIQKEAEKEAADIALLQAIETYHWAVKGFATVE